MPSPVEPYYTESPSYRHKLRSKGHKVKENIAGSKNFFKHRAMVEVTKDGTEGAAASAIEVVPLTANLQLPKIINIDKPFLFFVRDTVLKTLLFAGKYTNLEPNADQKC